MPDGAALSLDQVAEHADLGLPVPAGARQRTLQRFVSRLCWPFLRHQVLVNHAVAESLRSVDELCAAVRRLELAVSDLAQSQSALRFDLGHIASVTERQDKALELHERFLERHDSAFDVLDDRMELVALKADLVHRQSMSVLKEAIGNLEAALGTLRPGVSSQAEGLAERRREQT